MVSAADKADWNCLVVREKHGVMLDKFKRSLISRTFLCNEQCFFSHIKSANNTFNHDFSAKRTGPLTAAE
jgi:hypothetical protein